MSNEKPSRKSPRLPPSAGSMVETLVETFNPSSILLHDFSDMCDFREFVFQLINRGQNRPGPRDFDVCVANDVSCAIVTILQRELHLIFQLF